MLMKNLKYLFLIFCSFSIGQNVTVNSGATITVGSGGTGYTNGTITIEVDLPPQNIITGDSAFVDVANNTIKLDNHYFETGYWVTLDSVTLSFNSSISEPESSVTSGIGGGY